MKARKFAFISVLLALLGIVVLFAVPIFSVNLYTLRGSWTTLPDVIKVLSNALDYVAQGHPASVKLLFTVTAMYMAIGACAAAAVLLLIGMLVKRRRVLMIIGCSFLLFGLVALHLFYINYLSPTQRLIVLPEDFGLLFTYIGPGMLIAPLLFAASVALGLVSAIKEQPKKAAAPPVPPYEG